MDAIPDGESLNRPYDDAPPHFESTAHSALEDALALVDANCERYGRRFPSAATTDRQYDLSDEPSGWTPSFWTGILWLADEVTDDPQYGEFATSHLEPFVRRLEREVGTKTHDLGFLYTLSHVAAWKRTDDGTARQTAIRAADCLADRFRPEAGVIQAWGDLDDPDPEWPGEWGRGRIIADTMMNVPLLLWAGQTTGEVRYRDVATSHADRALEYLVRDDGSTFHTFKFDPETGDPIGGETHQGASDDSCWSRGQAWMIYGFAVCARYTGTDRFTAASRGLANYYLNRLPDDYVPAWDFSLADDPSVERDSSAAAIAACGLLELAQQLPAADETANQYRSAALSTLDTLQSEYADTNTERSGLLDHAVYNYPSGEGIDEACLWGDYFYLEGLVRSTTTWRPYW